MKQDPRPFAFRCTSELRDEIERRAEVAGVRCSDVIRQLLEQALADSDLHGEGKRIERVEVAVGELLLHQSQLIHAIGVLGQQLRAGVEAILTNLDEDSSGKLQKWLERRFPPIFAEERAG